MAINVLILCTGNSARSVLGEAILNKLGRGRFHAFSAGSKPVGQINPVGEKLLLSKGYDTAGLRSKSWDEFAAPNAPQMDIVITVCDSAAGETCPVWPGAPVRQHWGFPDPAQVEGSEQQKLAVFDEVYASIEAFMHRLVALPIEDMPAEDRKRALSHIKNELQG